METFLKILKYAIIFYVLFVALATIFQEKIIFRNTKIDVNYQYQFKENFEELWFQPEVNVKLNALYFKTDSVKRKGLILYFHGNADDLRRWGKFAKDFTKNNYDILMIDYRQFGKSTGEMSEQAFHADARYVYEWAKKRFPENEIIIYGRSLGTGIATRLASETRPKMLMLETPYYSLIDVGMSYLPIIPYDLLLRYKMRTDLFIRQVRCQIHIFHGTKDEVVPYEQSLKLVTILNKKPPEILTTIPNGKHKNLGEFREYQMALERLLSVKGTR
jgi:uncharacterized protein